MVFGLINKVQAKLIGGTDADEIGRIMPISDCPSECQCSAKYPSSMKIDESTNLNNSTSPYKLHCIIPTGKADWQHNATDTDHSVEKAVSKWAKHDGEALAGGSVKVSVSNFALDDGCSVEVNDVLLLPYFVWVKRVPAAGVGAVLSALLPILINITKEEGGDQKQRKALPAEVKGYKLVPSGYRSYIFLCSHRTRDKRCGITAPIIKKEFDTHLRDLGLLRDFGDDRAGGVKVGYINHVGGHKFAANLLIYLKTGEMVWYARVTPANVKPILDETVLGGAKVWPEKVRLVQRACAVSW